VVFLVGAVGLKARNYLEKDPNQFIVTEGIQLGYYPESTEFDRHLLAIGLTYKAEYQD